MKKPTIENVNLRTIEVYPIVKKEYETLCKRINQISENLKELKITRSERGYYLINLKVERDEALKFLKKRRKELKK